MQPQRFAAKYVKKMDQLPTLNPTLPQVLPFPPPPLNMPSASLYAKPQTLRRATFVQPTPYRCAMVLIWSFGASMAMFSGDAFSFSRILHKITQSERSVQNPRSGVIRTLLALEQNLVVRINLLARGCSRHRFGSPSSVFIRPLAALGFPFDRRESHKNRSPTLL